MAGREFRRGLVLGAQPIVQQGLEETAQARAAEAKFKTVQRVGRLQLKLKQEQEAAQFEEALDRIKGTGVDQDLARLILSGVDPSKVGFETEADRSVREAKIGELGAREEFSRQRARSQEFEQKVKAAREALLKRTNPNIRGANARDTQADRNALDIIGKLEARRFQIFDLVNNEGFEGFTPEQETEMQTLEQRIDRIIDTLPGLPEAGLPAQIGRAPLLQQEGHAQLPGSIGRSSQNLSQILQQNAGSSRGLNLNSRIRKILDDAGLNSEQTDIDRFKQNNPSFK